MPSATCCSATYNPSGQVADLVPRARSARSPRPLQQAAPWPTLHPRQAGQLHLSVFRGSHRPALPLRLWPELHRVQPVRGDPLPQRHAAQERQARCERHGQKHRQARRRRPWCSCTSRTMRSASVVRPVKELKDFRKLMLQPGEEKVVRFSIDEDKLKFFNAQLKYVAEAGEFNLQIGLDSQAVKQQTFQPGNDTELPAASSSDSGDGSLRSPACWCAWCPTPLYQHYHDTEWGFPVDRRPAPVREAVPRRLPGRPELVDHPEQARGLPRGLRRLRAERWRASTRRMSSACSAMPASCAIAARSIRRSTTRTACSNCSDEFGSMAALLPARLEPDPTTRPKRSRSPALRLRPRPNRWRCRKI